MTTRILRGAPVAGMVALKLQTVYQRFLTLSMLSQKPKCAMQSRSGSQGATQHQSLPPADARRQQGAEHRQILIMLARFQQRNERQEVPDEGATPMPSDVETISMEGRSIEHTLDLSASRAHDSALEILGAYKLTGNFHINLEIVLKNIVPLRQGDVRDRTEVSPALLAGLPTCPVSAHREHSHERVQPNHGLPKRAHRVRRDVALVGESLALATRSA